MVHRRWLAPAAALAAAVMLLAACSEEKEPPAKGKEPGKGAAASGALAPFSSLSGTIEIAGGTAHIPVMKEAAERIMAACPGIRITVAGGGTGVGIKSVKEGLVDIGNAGRALKPEEKEGTDLRSFPFAIDGVAACVHPSNVVSDLTPEQVQAIFAGKISNWKEVGGADAAITLYTRDEASGTREVFWELLLKKGAVADRANVVASNGAMKTAVAQDPNAIGYLSIGHVDRTVKALAIGGVAPTQENAVSGKYVATRKLYMNTKGEPRPLVRAFIDYICGPEGAEIVKKAGYIPIPKQ